MILVLCRSYLSHSFQTQVNPVTPLVLCLKVSIGVPSVSKSQSPYTGFKIHTLHFPLFTPSSHTGLLAVPQIHQAQSYLRAWYLLCLLPGSVLAKEATWFILSFISFLPSNTIYSVKPSLTNPISNSNSRTSTTSAHILPIHYRLGCPPTPDSYVEALTSNVII